jgi:hypothetical protein
MGRKSQHHHRIRETRYGGTITSWSKYYYFCESHSLSNLMNPIHFGYPPSDHHSEQILLRRQQQPDPRGDDLERITRARQAAEALFTSKPPVSRPSVPDAASADLSQRKPRVLRIVSPPAIRLEGVKAPVSREPQPAIPPSHFSRIRTLVKYGMTITQVAEVYGADIGEIERILGKIY